MGQAISIFCYLSLYAMLIRCHTNMGMVYSLGEPVSRQVDEVERLTLKRVHVQRLRTPYTATHTDQNTVNRQIHR